MKYLYFLSLILLPISGFSATFTVTNINDSGSGSLRATINSLNETSGSHILDLSGVFGTIFLESELSHFTKSVTIIGPETDTLVISKNPAENFRIFTFEAGTAEISNLVLENGLAEDGGGIYSMDLTLDHVIIRNCSAGSGGGIYHEGVMLEMLYCSIENNSAEGTGGALYLNGGEIGVENCTISGNSASAGGAIYAYGNYLYIRNSTISGNTAVDSSGGGIYADHTSTIVQSINSTIVYNAAATSGGGIYLNNNNLLADNSIFTGNQTSGISDDINGTGSYSHHGGHNIFGTTAFSTYSTDLREIDAKDVIEPNLLDNGGATKTHALKSCSPAIDNGNYYQLPSTDQRDSTRLGEPDIGSYEYKGANSIPLVTTNPEKQHICQQHTANFSAKSLYSDSIQWQVNPNTGTYENIIDNSNYTGTNSDTLSVNPEYNFHGYKYRAMFANSCGSVSSEPATLLVDSTIHIQKHPKDVHLCAGGNTEWMEADVNGGNFSYKWQVNTGAGFHDINRSTGYYNGGLNDPALGFANISSGMDGELYRMIASDVCGNQVVSDNAQLHVYRDGYTPASGQDLQDMTIVEGSNKTITAGVTDWAHEITWQGKTPTGTSYFDISNSTTYYPGEETLTIKNATSSMEGYAFRAVLKGCGTGNESYTNDAKLHVLWSDLCMVTVDQNTGNNIIVITKPVNVGAIESFGIYKEGSVTNEFEKIGSIRGNEMSTFIDKNSNPSQQPYLYKVVVTDTNGINTSENEIHKTIHLSVSAGTNANTWNLIWNGYQGIPVSSYHIYRGNSPSNMEYITSVSGNVTSYTDNSAPSGEIYYLIQVDGVSCNPTARTTNYTAIKSNLAVASITGNKIKNNKNKLNIFPNPARDYIMIPDIEKGAFVQIYDLTGRLIQSKFTNSKIDVSKIESGNYLIVINKEEQVLKFYFSKF